LRKTNIANENYSYEIATEEHSALNDGHGSITYAQASMLATNVRRAECHEGGSKIVDMLIYFSANSAYNLVEVSSPDRNVVTRWVCPRWELFTFVFSKKYIYELKSPWLTFQISFPLKLSKQTQFFLINSTKPPFKMKLNLLASIALTAATAVQGLHIPLAITY